MPLLAMSELKAKPVEIAETSKDYRRGFDRGLAFAYRMVSTKGAVYFCSLYEDHQRVFDPTSDLESQK